MQLAARLPNERSNTGLSFTLLEQIDEGVALIKEALGTPPDSSIASLLATVHAEAGFIQFNELHFASAVDHFLLSSTFEPPELFPFFPAYTARWRSIVPRKRYWGLHPPPQARALSLS